MRKNSGEPGSIRGLSSGAAFQRLAGGCLRILVAEHVGDLNCAKAKTFGLLEAVPSGPHGDLRARVQV